MLRSVDLSDYMLQNPVKIHADADLFAAVDLIIEHKISGLCVVGENDALVGVLSEMDCLKAILSAVYDENSNVGNVSDYMTADVDTCELHANVVDVTNDMLQKGHRRRPVVSNGRLVGQITCRRLLSVVSEFNKN